MPPGEEGGGEEGDRHQDQDVQWAGGETIAEEGCLLIKMTMMVIMTKKISKGHVKNKDNVFRSQFEKENFSIRVDFFFLAGEEQGGLGEDDGQQRVDEEQLQLCHRHDHVL